MAQRIKPAERLGSILTAATRVFCARDFKRAQMSDVALEMGCAAGTLYNYFESKEALFEYVVRHGLGEPLPDTSACPLKLPETGSTFGLIAERARIFTRDASIQSALRVEDPDNAHTEVSTLTNELFDFFKTYRLVLQVLEVSYLDYPDLAEVYNKQRQDLIFDPWSDLINKRQLAGIYKKIDDPVWISRLIIEMVAWAAWKACGHEMGYDENRSRAAVLEIVMSTLLERETK